MESANDKFSIGFKEYKKKLIITKSILTNNYLHSVKSNRATLELLEPQYSAFQSSLEKKYSSSKSILNEIMQKNNGHKENCLAKIEKFFKELEELESSKRNINNLSESEQKKIFETFQGVSHFSKFTKVRLNNMNPKIFDCIFEFSMKYQKGYRVRWFFVDPEEMVERPFIKSVERQLENGYLRDSCEHRLKLDSGLIFGYADYNSMKIETLNPKSQLTLLRKESHK